MIPFTRENLADGSKQTLEFERPAKIEAMARFFLDRGGWFEIHVLSTGDASVMACAGKDERHCYALTDVVEDGPEVPAAVDRVVQRTLGWIPGLDELDGVPWFNGRPSQ